MKIKKDNLTLLALTITFIAAYIETDIYIPSFPEMLEFFKTDEKTLQLVVSMNFAGIFLGSLISGPISDSYGRRAPILIALLGFTISSLGCALSEHITSLILWRFIQGAFVAIPMATPCAIIMDKYPPEKAARLIAFLSGIVTATLAFAPATGGWLQISFGWQSTFLFITLFATFSFVANFFYLEETLEIKNRTKINLKQTIADYFLILRNQQFMYNTGIMSLMYASFLIYLSNLSLIFITHLSMPEKTFVFYQSATMMAYVLGSVLATRTINKLGLVRTRNLGSSLAMGGALLFFCVSCFASTTPTFITGAFTLISLGSALSMGAYFVNSVEPFPTMNGKAMAMNVSLRQLLTSAIILISSAFFNGSIMPVSIAILALAFLCIIFFKRINKIQRVKSE
jgi:DHA1 family bicyclomycin/chloramphenicol resistance-like MFS transporter